MALIKCPQCQREVSDKALICPQCGFSVAEYIANSNSSLEVNNSKKKTLKTILPVVSVILTTLLIVGLVVGGMIRDKREQSKQAYEEAVQLKANHQYQAAIDAYNQVATWDENYTFAQSGIDVCESIIKNNEQIAVYFDALRDKHGVTLNDLRGLFKYSDGYLFDTGSMGYAVGKSIPSYIKNQDQYYQSSTDYDSGFIIVQYKAKFIENGWLTESTNRLAQETADIMFEIEAALSIEMDLKPFKTIYETLQ